MQESIDLDDIEVSDETDEERQARLDSEVVLDELSKEFVAKLVDKVLVLVDEISGHPLHPYQTPFARRVVESIVIGDGETITALFSRQCIDGDGIVFRRDGTAVRMRDHEDSFSTGVKPTKRYRMRGGGEIIATDNHPVRTPDGWVGVGMLRPGDKVAVATEMANWGSLDVLDRQIEIGRHKTPRRVKVEITEDIGKILGYFITDGSHRPGQSAKFTNNREEYLSEFSDLVENSFGIVPKRYTKGKGADLLITTTKSTYGNPFRDFLHSLQWDHGFPVDVFSFPPDVISALVNRAWSGDGCITMKKCGPDVFLACGNDEIYARYWQALLLKFGIMSTVKREQMAKGTGTFHRLVVGCGAKNIRRFIESFGLIYGKEQQTYTAAKYFDDKCARPSGKGRAEKVMYPTHGWGPDGERMSWAVIQSIEDAGEREVFDMHVEGKGWFIYQGVQVSNSGKSESVANVVAACMILFPRLAQMFPDLMGKFKEGLWVGAFAPVDEQADTLYGRIVARLTSDRALEFMSDPEIGEEVIGRGRELRLKHCGSLVRKTTCHPRAKIEGRTYHLILIDECQDAEEKVVNKSISPMGASTNATMVFTGTPSYVKGVFYKQIQINKRAATKRGARTNHFEADYKTVGKYNANYKKFVAKEILRIGVDSDEFKLSYRLIWLLDRGMFTTSEKMDSLGDKTMQAQHAWMKSPVVVGIDPARKIDSTVVTVVWVGWDYPDQFGRFEHRVLNWLDLTGVEWEEQYFRITEFLANYHVFAIGVDAGGVGDTVISRLRTLMPGVEIVPAPSDRSAQSKRWRYLMDLMRDGKIGWPDHAATRRLRTWKRFRQQMEDAELRFEGPNVIVEAPKEVGAHDDYVDSLSIAVSVSEEFAVAEVEESTNYFYAA